MVPRSIMESNQLSEYRAAIFFYLMSNRLLSDQTKLRLSFYDLIKYCGFTPSKRKNRINDQLLMTLNLFYEEGLFTLDSWLDLKGNNLVTLTLLDEIYNTETGFGMIYYSELDIIMKYKDSLTNLTSKDFVSVHRLLLIFSYIKVNIWKRTDILDNKPAEKPLVLFRHMNKIASDLDMHVDTIVKAMKLFTQLDLIICKRLKRIQDKEGNWYTPPSIIVSKVDGWEEELRLGEEFYNKRKIETKKFYQPV